MHNALHTRMTGYLDCAEAVLGDQDLLDGLDPHKAGTRHSVNQHGRIGSHPYEQLDYHRHDTLIADDMHTCAGHVKGSVVAILGKEITKALAKDEVEQNHRYEKNHSAVCSPNKWSMSVIIKGLAGIVPHTLQQNA